MTVSHRHRECLSVSCVSDRLTTEPGARASLENGDSENLNVSQSSSEFDIGPQECGREIEHDSRTSTATAAG
jgi:hypothetical protein